MMRVFVGMALLAGMICAQETTIKVSPEREALLKERVAKFWDSWVSGKFRLGDEYVAEEAKDDYYNWPKKKIKHYKVDKIYYADGGKAAKVVVVAGVNMNMMGVGAMDVDQPVETWWRLEHDTWYWFQPKNEKRQTPFGVMDTNPASGQVALVPEGQFLKGPDQNTLYNMVKPDRTEVHFAEGTEKTESVQIKSAMPGIVLLTIDVPQGDEFGFSLSSNKIPRQGTESLNIKYVPKPGVKLTEPIVRIVKVGVAQTGMIYSIRAVVDPKK